MLHTAPGAAQSLGLEYLKAMVRDNSTPATIAEDIIVHCGKDGALAQQAILMGFKNISASFKGLLRSEIENIAKQADVNILADSIHNGGIDLADYPEPETKLLAVRSDFMGLSG